MPGSNEADTCRIYIIPALTAAGWGNPNWRITEQHYFTDGQIYLVGDYDYRRKGGRLYAGTEEGFICR
jgi:type I restriction enzyme R subunit